MPPTLETRTVTNVAEYVELAQSYADAATEGRAWFRGCRDSTFKLQPSLYRRAGHSPQELVEMETTMLSTFRDRSLPYSREKLADAWETSFVMQHYGAPTRLLDWSENALVGLYFAVVDAEGHGFPGDAAVWILDPNAWNAHALPHAPRAGKVLSGDDDALVAYSPERPIALMHDLPPAAIYGRHNSPRIVAQRGAFTVFSLDPTPMEETYIARDFPQDALLRIALPRGDLPSLAAAMRALGMSESMIYPDLGGLAREIKHSFGF